jgi:ribonuclease VapC
MVMARKRLEAPWEAVSDLDAYLLAANVQIVDLDRAQARVAMEGRIRYGQGFGTGGGLNFGDSFAYALAKVRRAPLLYVGDDFSKTDIVSALA